MVRTSVESNRPGGAKLMIRCFRLAEFFEFALRVAEKQQKVLNYFAQRILPGIFY